MKSSQSTNLFALGFEQGVLVAVGEHGEGPVPGFDQYPGRVGAGRMERNRAPARAALQAPPSVALGARAVDALLQETRDRHR